MGYASHRLRFKPGTDPRNHIVRCDCGWSYSNTHNAVRSRGLTHAQTFKDETRDWDDKKRTTVMPMTDWVREPM